MSYAPMIAQRDIRLGDRITGLVATNSEGRHLWAGEFTATYGDGKVGRFLWGCDLRVVVNVFPVLEDGTVTMLTAHHMAQPTL